jgi:hypothetical protein
VEVLSLNGLRAAEGCENSFVVPLFGVRLFNTIGGTIPSCVWSLRNLSVLHLTGNGLSGELGQSLLPVSSQISDLSLSHNKLSGTIPLDILNVANLDLSYNQFSGEYQDRTQYSSDSNISLEINRLSGKLPASELERVSNGSLSILRGNIFSCNSVPENDDFSRDYVCGSRNLNDSLLVFVPVFSIAVLLVLFGTSARFVGAKQQHRLLADLRSKGVLLWTYMDYIKNLDARGLNSCSAVRQIAKLSGAFVEIMQCAVKLVVLILAGSMALYLVKELDSENTYSTHSHTYAWFWTVAYMRGVVPAGMLLMLWLGAISACFYLVIIIPRRRTGRTGSSSSSSSSSETPRKAPHTEAASQIESNFREHAVSVGAAFAFNACITIAVNAMYIYSTQQALGAFAHFCVQLSLSIFRLVYIAVAFPLLSRSIRSAVENVRFRFILLTINNLVIPCVVTVLTSDACFQVTIRS